MLHDPLNEPTKIESYMMFCSTFTDVNSSLSTVGAVTPVPMGPTYQTLGLAVREPMRLEGTNVVCTHTSLCMVALSISTALISP